MPSRFRRTDYAGRSFSTGARLRFQLRRLFLFKNLLFVAGALLLLLALLHGCAGGA